MKQSVVEGEPGIFPDPVARILRALSGLVTRRGRRAEPSPEPSPDQAEPQDQPPPGPAQKPET